MCVFSGVRPVLSQAVAPCVLLDKVESAGHKGKFFLPWCLSARGM